MVVHRAVKTYEHHVTNVQSAWLPVYQERIRGNLAGVYSPLKQRVYVWSCSTIEPAKTCFKISVLSVDCLINVKVALYLNVNVEQHNICRFKKFSGVMQAI